MLKKIAGILLAVGFAGLTWAQPIDLNKASEIELDGLKGVGPVLTKQVMTERQKTPFKDWDDVTSRVKGIGPQKANSLSEQGVRVQGNAFTGKAKNTPKDSGITAPKGADTSAAKAPADKTPTTKN